ncbi:MAG: hypothetical protein ACE5KF_12220 [Kiloniellaceae bacterium]
MPRDPRYDILFEPVEIGPVTAKNRFYQVPHCNGMGHRMPRATAAMRGMKAEGGWAVVCTEECEIHPSGDVTPAIEARLWDDSAASAARTGPLRGSGGTLEFAACSTTAGPPLPPTRVPARVSNRPVWEVRN